MTPEPSGALEACLCAADLLSAMQGLLAAVTDSEAAMRPSGSGLKKGWDLEANHRSLAELEAVHQHHRAMHEQRWGKLQGEAEIAERPAQA